MLDIKVASSLLCMHAPRLSASFSRGWPDSLILSQSRLATLKTSPMQARVCGNLLPKFWAANDNSKNRIQRRALIPINLLSKFCSMLIHKFRYEFCTELHVCAYGENYLLVSSHLVSSSGGQGGCRAHCSIGAGFTVRCVCRFATYPYKCHPETVAMSLTLPLQTHYDDKF